VTLRGREGDRQTDRQRKGKYREKDSRREESGERRRD